MARGAGALLLATVAAALALARPVIEESTRAGRISARIGSNGGSIGPSQEVPMQPRDFRSMSSLAARALAATTVAGAMGGVAADARAQAVQWRVEDGGNGHWYELRTFVGPIQFGALESYVEAAMGGHLATIPSIAEDNYVWNSLGRPAYAVLGGFQDTSSPDYSEPGGGWKWVTGEPISSFRWTWNEPSNGLGGGESVLAYNYDQTWNDWETSTIPTSRSFLYIVEWDADCNRDGIVDYGQIRAGQLADANGNNIPDCCEQGTSCEQADAGLQGHYALDGNCLDSSGFGRNGTATGIGYVAGPLGSAGTAASFDGSTSFIQIEGVPIPTDNAFSWVLWLRADAIGNSAVVERIQAVGNNLLSPSLAIRSTGAIGFGSYSFASGGTSVETAASTIVAGRWTHVACTSSATGVRRVYVNGALIGEGTAADYGQPLATILVGRDRLDCCDRFRGAIDDLRFYSRPLFATEVATLYAASAPCTGDIYLDRRVDGGDLGVLLSHWGPVGANDAAALACDLNRDGLVDGSDLGILLAHWGPCGN